MYKTTKVPAVIATLGLSDLLDLCGQYGLQKQIPINVPGEPYLQHLCQWSLDGWGCCDYSRGNARQRARWDAERHLNA